MLAHLIPPAALRTLPVGRGRRRCRSIGDGRARASAAGRGGVLVGRSTTRSGQGGHGPLRVQSYRTVESGMIGRGDRPGGSARHVPVLLKEACEALGAARGGVFVDGTFGAGGYTQAILRANPVNRVVAIDRDPEVIGAGAALAAKFKRRLTLASGRFGALVDILREAGHETVDGVVLDIGVSSMQLDQPERGFSFRANGPLDMRMERMGVSAADL